MNSSLQYLVRVNQGNEKPGIRAKGLLTEPAPMSLHYFQGGSLEQAGFQRQHSVFVQKEL